MRGVLWLEALRGTRRSSRDAQALVLLVALLMYGGIFAARLTVEEPGASVLVLLCLPVTLVAVSFGRWAGLAAAGLALALVEVWSLRGGHIGGIAGYLSRAVAYLLLGYLPGLFAERLAAVQEQADTAVRALEQSAAEFSAAFDHAPVGMALVGTDRRILRANAALAAMVGLSVNALVGLPIRGLKEPNDAAEDAERLDDVLAGRSSGYRTELRLMTTDRGLLWVSLFVARAPTEHGGYAVAHIEDISERKTFESQLRHLADHDALTGLFNRRRFREELEHHLALEARYGGGGALLLLDLDNFKYINDVLGHGTGDRLLQVIASTLRDRLRDSDLVSRLGGDEFAILLPAVDRSRAVEVARSLLDGIRSSDVFEAGRQVRSTGSIGITMLEQDPSSTADDVLATADVAMYAAKEAGRDGYAVYDAQGPYAARSQTRLRWLERIRHALEADLFVLHAQPILDLQSNRVTGCELLLRMREDERLVGPEEFLPVAERHGLAVTLDRWVIRRSMQLAAAQPRPPGFRWEINLSADALGNADIPQLIQAELAATGVTPSTLVFEITETAAITNMEHAQAFAAQVTAMGCGFALDDFGAGYGSFYYLKHLPFDYLKIDGEFIRHLTTDTVDRTIVQAIVSAARPLGKQTIAEYVGDAETLALLRNLHVDHAQGYHVGRPADPRLDERGRLTALL